MLAEYAVEPELIGSDFNLFCMLMGYFGMERGRLISQFPKHWSREVIKTAEASGIHSAKLLSLVERLNRAKVDVLVRRGREYEPALGDWMANAVAQHGKMPFRAIISGRNPTGHQAVLDVTNFDAGDHLLTVKTSMEVERTPQGVVQELKLMIQKAREVTIVDPFFEVLSPKFNGPLRYLFEELRSGNGAVRSVQVHRRFSGRINDLAVIGANAPLALRGVIPEGYMVEVYEWSELPAGDDLHDRLLITDCGGVSVGAGFSAEGAHQKALVSLLPISIVGKMMDRFRPGRLAYTLAQPVLMITSDCRVATRDA